MIVNLTHHSGGNMHLLFILSVSAHDHRHSSSTDSRHTPSIMIARGSLTPFTSFTPFPLREFGHPLIIHRIVRDSGYPYERHSFPPRRQAFAESFEDAVRGNKATEVDKPKGRSIGKVILFLIFMGLAGTVGFYLGKVNESRNYVRVPSVN